MLGVSTDSMEDCLTHQSIEARGQLFKGDLSREKALYARDALAKALYDRAFSWLVTRINISLESQDPGRKTVLGLLDIYGFEIMQCNSFE
jgi:myosin-1